MIRLTGEPVELSLRPTDAELEAKIRRVERYFAHSFQRRLAFMILGVVLIVFGDLFGSRRGWVRFPHLLLLIFGFLLGVFAATPEIYRWELRRRAIIGPQRRSLIPILRFMTPLLFIQIAGGFLIIEVLDKTVGFPLANRIVPEPGGYLSAWTHLGWTVAGIWRVIRLHQSQATPPVCDAES